MIIALSILTLPTPKILKFQKSKMVAAAILKKIEKSPYLGNSRNLVR